MEEDKLKFMGSPRSQDAQRSCGQYYYVGTSGDPMMF
jgi:hypothetical protein